MVLITNLKEREQYQIWRKRNRVRLVDVAQYCRCHFSLISMWENGKQNISDEIFAKYNEYIKKFEEGRIYATNE